MIGIQNDSDNKLASTSRTWSYQILMKYKKVRPIQWWDRSSHCHFNCRNYNHILLAFSSITGLPTAKKSRLDFHEINLQLFQTVFETLIKLWRCILFALIQHVNDELIGGYLRRQWTNWVLTFTKSRIFDYKVYNPCICAKGFNTLPLVLQ